MGLLGRRLGPVDPHPDHPHHEHEADEDEAHDQPRADAFVLHKDLGRFRELTFGDRVKEPTYRAVPTHQRSGAYADPFYYYYYDPYFGFTHFLLLDYMIGHDHWHTDGVAVVSPDGDTLYTGAEAAAHPEDRLDAEGSAVGFGDDGNLTVSDTIPAVSDAGGEDWGGSDIQADAVATGAPGAGDAGGSGFFSDFFGGDSGVGDGGGGNGTSCGSSCGGGGCGGGCGGS